MKQADIKPGDVVYYNANQDTLRRCGSALYGTMLVLSMSEPVYSHFAIQYLHERYSMWMLLSNGTVRRFTNMKFTEFRVLR